MARRNYYIVLGVDSTETARGIRAAFRDLARRYHPDHAGPAGTADFREIAEAYGVLGDPQRRRRYDEEVLHAPTSSDAAATSVVEPLVRDLSLRRDMVEVRPSQEVLFRRFERNFTGARVPKSESVQELQVDVAISREEADLGTTLRIGMPVFSRCLACRGFGCGECAGRGVVEYERRVIVQVPPLSGLGTTLVVPLDGLGITNLYMGVRVHVRPESEPT